MQLDESISIIDDDITWAEELLGLPEGAFDDERRDAIRGMGRFDVQACPGSGKTTLVVAKLAILAKKWPHSNQGICVISHTNVARREIQDRLGRTEVGQKLLSYPHFIGTIHAFVNQFVALPWIRSKGWPIVVVDTDITLNRRWYKLQHSTRQSNQLCQLQDKALESESIGTPPPIRSGRGYLRENSAMGKELRSAIADSYKEGYFTYDEMFLFADEAVSGYPQLPGTIAHRFPAFIVDEAQDCSESQNSILSKLFPASQELLVRQRFGDGNQAIFNSTHAVKSVTTDPFPDASKINTVSNSHRLHPSIAKLSDPLGLIPYNMTGIGQSADDAPSMHTIFVYKDATIGMVMPAYAALVLDQFSDEQLATAKCFAVGQVHNTTRDEPIGAHVQHYWAAYNPAIHKAEPSTPNLVSYFRSAIEEFRSNNELHAGMAIAFEGIVNLLRKQGVKDLATSGRPYRHLRDLSGDHLEAFATMCEYVKTLLVTPLSEHSWSEDFRSSICSWGNQCFGTALGHDDPYLDWKVAPNDQRDPVENRYANVFCFADCGRKVDIQMGSIHSVKGQTHRATLVLDTFWSGRNGKTNLAYISDWICGKKFGCGNEGANNLTRLKCHYVAMTRPTDLLCLAMQKTHVDGMREELGACGWNLVDL